jgi:hypothetical protein
LKSDVHARIYAAELAVMGGLGLASVFLPVEAAVFAGGPMLALVSLLYVVSKAVRGQMGLPIAFGLAGAILGVFLATHDYVFVGATAILVHLSIAICILGLAVFQTMVTFAPPRTTV